MPEDGRPYFTTSELARRIKAQRPQLANIPDDRLVAFWVQRFPEVREQIVDPTGGAKIGPARPGETAGERGSQESDVSGILGRYEDPNEALVEGAGKALGTMAKNITGWIPGLGRVSDAIPEMEYENPTEAAAGGAVNAAMFMTPSGAGRVTTAKLLENLPWLRAALAGGLEGAKGYGLTKAQGGSEGDAAFMGVTGGALGAAGAIPEVYLESARNNVARMVRAAESRVKGVKKVAERALSQGGLVGTLGGISSKVNKRLEAALRKKRAADQSVVPVNTTAADQELLKRANEVELPLPQRHPALTDTVLDELDTYPPQLRAAILRSLGVTEDQVKMASALRRAPRSGDPSLLSALEDERKDLERLATIFPEGIPYNVMATYRKGRGAVARRGGAYTTKAMPGVTPAPGAEAAKAGAGAMTPPMHAANEPARRADEMVHVYTTLKENLDRAGLREVAHTTENRFVEYLAFRVAAGAAIGAAGGAKQGDLVYGTLAGALGGAFMSSSFWHSLSGTTKFKLAKAIKSGNYELGVRILEGAAANWQTQNRLPRAPEE